MTATQHKNPRLRFPEFREDWCLDEIKDYLEEYIERVPSSTGLPVLTSSRSGLFLQKDYFKDRELANEGEYGVLPYGYITYRHMSDDSTFIFNINYLVEKGVVSKEYPVFKTNGLDIYFLQQVLNHGKAFKRFATEQKKGGTRTRLYFKNLLRFRVHLPPLPEQQKIATFLTNIDTRIQQLSRKKALLEQYKKGVMQQIFSQEIRFKDEDGKEFPAWEEKRLKDVFVIQYGKDYKHLERGSVPVLGTGGVMTFVNEYLYDQPSVLIGRKGSIDKPRYIDVPFWTVDTCFYTVINSGFHPFFVYLVVSHVNWLRYNEATGVPSLNTKGIYAVKIKTPSLTEQQKIAAFLSTIDRQINLASQQLNRMQTFKKGLLQQMFV